MMILALNMDDPIPIYINDLFLSKVRGGVEFFVLESPRIKYKNNF